MTLCTWLLTTSGPALADSHQTPLLGTPKCFSGLTSTDNVEVVLTSTFLTPWCCLVNTCTPWSHKLYTHSIAFAQDQSVCWGAMTLVSTEMGVELFYSLCIYPHMSPTCKYKPTETSLSSESHFSYCPILYVCFPFLLRMVCLLLSFLTSIPTLGFCTKCSAKTIIMILVDWQGSPNCPIQWTLLSLEDILLCCRIRTQEGLRGDLTYSYKLPFVECT